MKTLLIIILSLVTVGLAWQTHDLQQTLIPELRATLDTRTDERDTAVRQASDFQRQLVAVQARLDAVTDPLAESKPEPETDQPQTEEPQTQTPDPADLLAARLADLQRQYQEKKSLLDAKRQTLRENETRARAQREQARRDRPEFQELNTRTLADGTVITTGGIRTSDADRQKTTAEWQARLDHLDAYLREIAIAHQQLDEDYHTLERNYQTARTQAETTYR